jgi:hypothetical protein
MKPTWMSISELQRITMRDGYLWPVGKKETAGNPAKSGGRNNAYGKGSDLPSPGRE